MAGEVDEYLDFYAEADKTHRAFKAMVGELAAYVESLKESPERALTPPQNWPTTGDITSLYTAMFSKTTVVKAKYAALTKEQQSHVQPPSKLGQSDKSARR